MKVEYLKYPDAEWNTRVKSLPEGNINQTTFYARHLRSHGLKTIWIQIRDGDSIVAQASIFKGVMGWSRAKNLIMPTLSLRDGLLVFDKSREDEIYELFLQEIEKLARRQYIYGAKDFMPPLFKNQDAEKIRRHYQEFGYDSTPWATSHVDLTRGVEELWKRCKVSGRNDVRRHEKQGVIIREAATFKEFCEFYKMYKGNMRRNEVRGWSFSIHRNFWNVIFKKGMAKCFLQYYEGKPIAGILFSMFNGIMRQGPAQSNFSIENRIGGPASLTWHAIKWGAENGQRIFDLVGVCVDPEKAPPKERGLYIFKSKWGGEIVRSYVYSRTFSRKRKLIIDFYRRVKRFIKKD